MRLLSLLILSGPLLASCSGSPAETSSGSGGSGGSRGSTMTTTTAATTSSGSGGETGAPIIGGDRPVEVLVPTNYSKDTPAPLLLMLHGSGVGGVVEELYLHLAPVADAHGFLYAHPDGTVDSEGMRFWNATGACCNYHDSKVDDSAYLSSVIEEIEKAYNVDPKRVYILGHSNGGYMAYRMACDHAEQIAGIVSLAGAMWQDESKCQPKDTVHVLEIHGTADMSVLYDGAPGSGKPGDGPYPGAETSVLDWATLDGCSLTPDKTSPPLDLETTLDGPETTVEKYEKGCKPGGSAQLWTITGGGHLPTIDATFREDVFGYMSAHSKP